MNQGASGVKEYIQGKESKHCFVYVEKGSYFSGAGMAQFNIDYSESVDSVAELQTIHSVTKLHTRCPTRLWFRAPVVLWLYFAFDFATIYKV